MVSHVHTGKKVVWDNPGTYQKIKILQIFSNVFLEWLGINIKKLYELNRIKSFLYFVLLFLFFFIQVTTLDNEGHILMFTSIAILVYSLIISPFHFCFKRIISVFPMVFVLITTMIDTVIVKYSVNSLFVEILLLLVVTLTVIYHIKDAILVNFLKVLIFIGISCNMADYKFGEKEMQ